jgi:hypothetical protein
MGHNTITGPACVPAFGPGGGGSSTTPGLPNTGDRPSSSSLSIWSLTVATPLLALLVRKKYSNI